MCDSLYTCVICYIPQSSYVWFTCVICYIPQSSYVWFTIYLAARLCDSLWGATVCPREAWSGWLPPVWAATARKKRFEQWYYREERSLKLIRKFNDIALQMWWCDWNRWWNSVEYVLGAATCIYIIILLSQSRTSIQVDSWCIPSPLVRNSDRENMRRNCTLWVGRVSCSKIMNPRVQ